ncbi:MAG: metallophosphoesterase family protein [Candidatus Omnitrophota bacterium]
MKIGILSDTHSRRLPAKMMADFKAVDCIIHTGDFCSWEVYQELAKVKEIHAVSGNMDEHKVREQLPQRRILELEGCRIGVYHGRGAPDHLLEVVQAEFVGDNVDVVIFGHSHQPFNKKIGKVLYFNPGSPNDTVFAPYCSYGIMEIKEGHVEAKIIEVR